MKKTTLTESNLVAIKNAMEKIDLIDRSEYFANYYKEVLSRLDAKEKDKKYLN